MASNRIGWLLRWMTAGAAACFAMQTPGLPAKDVIGSDQMGRLVGAVEAGALSQSNASTGGATSPFLKAAPDLFDASGLAVWDGKRTLQGIWVAHPLATSARRVRIFNSENGLAVDGALFKRDSTLSGASVLISSEAAALLKMSADTPTKLRIVAVTPSRRDRTNDVAATSESSGTPNSQPVAETPENGSKPETGTATSTEPSVPETTGSSGTAEVAATPSTAPTDPKPVATPAPAETAAVANPSATVEQDSVPKPKPARQAEQTTVATAPTPPAPEPAKDPKTGPLNLTEPNLAAAQPDRAATRALNSQSGQVADPQTDSRPSIGSTGSKQTTGGTASIASKPKETTVAQAASPLTRPFVQAGIFSVAKNAQKLISQLQSAEIPAVGKPMRFRGQSMTRVLAGPFRTSADRRAAQQFLKRFGIRDAVPVRR